MQIGFWLTPFGVVWLTVLGFAFVFGARWLFALVLLSSVLHFVAVAYVSMQGLDRPLGFSPWVFAVAACASSALRERLVSYWQRGGYTDAVLDQKTRSWAFFFLGCAVISLVLPLIFRGSLVYWPGNVYGFDEPPKALEVSPTNVAMSLNALLLCLLFVYAGSVGNRFSSRNQIIAGFCLAVIGSLFVNVFHRLVLERIVNLPEWVSSSINASYVAGTEVVLGFERATWPFSEPSYASVWFASVLVSGWTLCLVGRMRVVGIGLILCGMFGLVNTLGLTGIVAAVCGICITLGGYCTFWLRRAGCGKQTLSIKTAFVASLSIGGVLFLSVYGTEAINQFLCFFWDKFVEELSMDSSRMRSNVHGIKLAWETYGIGVGLGSNRASSYLANLLSGIGLIGTAIFGVLLVSHGRDLARLREDPLSVALCAGGGTAFIGVAIGIPDFAWPGWWVWVFAGFALICYYNPQQRRLP